MPRPRLVVALAFCALIGAGLTAACGEPPPRLAGKPASRLAGIDEDAPIEGRPGHYRKTVLTKSYPLRAGSVNLHAEPFRIRRFRADERVWITRWRSNTEDPDGTRAPDDIHCHTTLSDRAMIQDDGQLFVGLYTDGFTPAFELPPGFAIPVEPGQRMIFQPMFNNRRPRARRARMRLEVDYVPESERTVDYRSLSSYMIRVSRFDLYWVEPGATDLRHRVVEVPFEGRVHAIGAHLHPYGKYVELRREHDGEVLHTCEMDEAAQLEDQRLSTYVSAKGFFLRRGESVRVTTLYENTSDEKIDAMGGLFVLYDPEGKPDA